MAQEKAAWLRKIFFLIILFLNWQTPFGSNRVPADLMNDNVGQMYKNFEANSVSSPTRYLVCMASFNYTKHLKRGIPNCS